MKISLQQRFERYVFYGSPCGCHYWISAVSSGGYGCIWVNRKPAIASRIAYLIYKGEIPDGLCVLHQCDNKLCVNPDHLFLGTIDENNKDRAKKGRTIARSGSLSNNSKLNEIDIPVIRELYKGGLTMIQLAESFNVSSYTIYSIINKKTWKHV